MEHHEDAAPVRTDEDLRQRWSSLLRNDGFAHRQLWLTWFDADGHQLPVVMPIECRPGPADVSAQDRAWARALYGRAASGLPMRQLHLATAGSIRPLVLDDVA